jgi:hypothetical protein
VDGNVNLILANAVCDFCTTCGSAFDPIYGGHITLSAAVNSTASHGVGGILAVPYEQADLVTPGYYAAVYEITSNLG